MALIVETGTGSTTANSFVADTEFVTWAKARGYTTYPESGAERAPFLVLAADYLANEKRFRWRGTRNTAAQALPWPRTGVVDRDGLSWASNAVPWRVKQAQCALAWLAMNGTELQPVLERGGRVASESIGPISVTYANDAPAEPEIIAALGIIEILIWSQAESRLRQIPTITDSVAVDGFEGEYAPENVSP